MELGTLRPTAESESIAASKGLDEKTKQLIYIAMKASNGDVSPVNAHVPMAKKLGATIRSKRS